MKDETIVYTIGHGRHAWVDFLALLKKYEIAFLCVIILISFPMLES
jgi:hypothetical protein